MSDIEEQVDAAIKESVTQSKRLVEQSARDVVENRWWGTFNAVMSRRGPIESSLKATIEVCEAHDAAFTAHGFTPDSYKGEKYADD